MAMNQTPPQLINTLINFVLKMGKTDDPMYPWQWDVQKWLLICMVGSVPWMLLIKPIVLASYFKKHPHKECDSELMKNPTLLHDEEEPTSFSELFIFQAIEVLIIILSSIYRLLNIV